MDARSASVHVIFCPCFFLIFLCSPPQVSKRWQRDASIENRSQRSIRSPNHCRRHHRPQGMSHNRHPLDRLANVENAKSGRPTDMEDIYVDVRSPGSFGDIRNLRRYSGRSEREVKTFLARRDTYTLQKLRRIIFPCRKT